MKAEYLNPFVIATADAWKTMVGIEPAHGDLSVVQDQMSGREFTAVLGFTGKVKGSLVIAMDEDVAQPVVQRFTSAEEDVERADLCDALGELCNIIGGSAKAELNKLGLNLSMALPNVLVGKDIEIGGRRRGVTLLVPFTTDIGPFDMRVSLG